jgi:hypothetical protein
MISKSPNTLIFSIFKSMDFLRPCTSASYFTVLLVQSNSNLQERKTCVYPLDQSTNNQLQLPLEIWNHQKIESIYQGYI